MRLTIIVAESDEEREVWETPVLTGKSEAEVTSSTQQQRENTFILRINLRSQRQGSNAEEVSLVNGVFCRISSKDLEIAGAVTKDLLLVTKR